MQKETATEPSKEFQFECNVCLENVQQPVVTLCGHLYCWPCLYTWLQKNNSCPVCKAGVTEENVIPLYGRGSENQVDPRSLKVDSNIPARPTGQRPEPEPRDFQFSRAGMREVINEITTNARFFPSIFNSQIRNILQPSIPVEALTEQQIQQAFVSRMLLFLGSLVIICLIYF